MRAWSAGRLHAQSDLWAENPWPLTAFERLAQWQASVAAASTEKPSHVVLWHKLIDAARSCHNCSCQAVLIAVNLCRAEALHRSSCRSDAKRGAYTRSSRADNC